MKYLKWASRAAAVLAAVAPVGQARADGPATCSFDSATATVTVVMDGVPTVLKRTADGAIRLDDVACSGATVFNTDTILVEGTPFDVVSIEGDFAPGKSPDLGRSEIEFTLSRPRLILLRMGEGDDQVIATDTGLDIGGDGDTDILTGLMPRTIEGRGGNDIIDMTLRPGAILHGDGGDDILLGGEVMFGGEGKDFLVASDLDTRMTGGPGDDVMQGGDHVDVFVVGPVADGADLIDGGPARDFIDYGQRTADVTVTSGAGGADDGELGEGDQVARVEHIFTGSGNDFVIGTSSDDDIRTGDGDDQISAGGGADTVMAGPGDDVIEGGEGRNRIDAGDGNDVILCSSPSDDGIVAGAGDDQIMGNADGNLDNLDCGAGNDIAEADANDTFSACEVLQ